MLETVKTQIDYNSDLRFLQAKLNDSITFVAQEIIFHIIE
jgi:hypothetical protein